VFEKRGQIEEAWRREEGGGSAGGLLLLVLGVRHSSFSNEKKKIGK